MTYKPIPEEWIKSYVDQLLTVAEKLEVGSPMRQAALLRVEHVMDLVTAWRALEQFDAVRIPK